MFNTMQIIALLENGESLDQYEEVRLMQLLWDTNNEDGFARIIHQVVPSWHYPEFLNSLEETRGEFEE